MIPLDQEHRANGADSDATGTPFGVASSGGAGAAGRVDAARARGGSAPSREDSGGAAASLASVRGASRWCQVREVKLRTHTLPGATCELPKENAH